MGNEVAQYTPFLFVVWIVGFFVVLGTLAKVLSVLREYKEEARKTREGIYEDVERQKKLDHIISHDLDLDKIAELVETQCRHDEYLERDYQAINETRAQVAVNQDQIASLKEPMILLLQANLSTMQSLKEKGINHQTEDSIRAIQKFLMDYYKK